MLVRLCMGKDKDTTCANLRASLNYCIFYLLPTKDSITLAATPDTASGSVFAGWSGVTCDDGSNKNSTCKFSIAATNPTVTATFNIIPPTYKISVVKDGNGAGTITSDLGGLNCDTNNTKCSSDPIGSGKEVTLTALPNSGSTIINWSGCAIDPKDSGRCTITISANQTIVATFADTSRQYALYIKKDGTSSGSIITGTVTNINNKSGKPDGSITCDTKTTIGCSNSFSYGTGIKLTPPNNSSGSIFMGWSGVCSGTSVCIVNMTDVRSVTATFNDPKKSPMTYILSVDVAIDTGGFGTRNTSVVNTGIISSGSDGLINCNRAKKIICSASIGSGKQITLTATPAPANSVFAYWTGGCSGSGNCTVSMTKAQKVIAAFKAATMSPPPNKPPCGSKNQPFCPLSSNWVERLQASLYSALFPWRRLFSY